MNIATLYATQTPVLWPITSDRPWYLQATPWIAVGGAFVLGFIVAKVL